MAESKYTTPEQIEEMRRELARLKEPGAHDGDKRDRSRVLKLIGRAAFLAVIALLVYAIVMIQTVKSQGKTPDLLGFYLFSVESGSMEPTLNIGSIIISRASAHPEKLNKNDIVTFRTRTGAVVTHRIIDIIKNENGSIAYQTKGDNPINSPDEELLTPDRIIALYVGKVPLT